MTKAHDTSHVVDLATVPHGWPPVAWIHRLRQLADRCESLNPRRAEELREAANTLERARTANAEDDK